MRATEFGPLRGVRDWIKRRRHTSRRAVEKIIPEISAGEAALMRRYAPFTMTSIERQWALIKAVEYLNGNKIAGDFVECGVWRGGSTMVAAMTFEPARVAVSNITIWRASIGSRITTFMPTSRRAAVALSTGAMRPSGALGCNQVRNTKLKPRQ